MHGPAEVLINEKQERLACGAFLLVVFLITIRSLSLLSVERKTE